MKSSNDPRHKRRRKLVQFLFASSFSKQPQSEEVPEEVYETAQLIVEKMPEFDQMVADAAPQWPIDKLNKIDLAILRLAVYELTNTDTPPKVIVDEAVELAKEFGGETTPSFVNGVLGNILNKVVGPIPEEVEEATPPATPDQPEPDNDETIS